MNVDEYLAARVTAQVYIVVCSILKFGVDATPQPKPSTPPHMFRRLVLQLSHKSSASASATPETESKIIGRSEHFKFSPITLSPRFNWLWTISSFHFFRMSLVYRGLLYGFLRLIAGAPVHP